MNLQVPFQSTGNDSGQGYFVKVNHELFQLCGEDEKAKKQTRK